MRVSYRQIFLVLVLSAAAVVAGARVAYSQTPIPPPRIPLLVWDDNGDFTSTYTAPDPLAGQSFIKEVRVILTPVAGGSPVVSVVPIGQVERGTIASACPAPPRQAGEPPSFPCRKIRDLATPFGAFHVTIAAVDRRDRVGPPSTDVVPFTGAEPTPVRPVGVRIP